MFEQDVVGESPGNVKDVEQGLSSELSSGDVGAKDVEQNLYSVLDFVKHVSRLAIYRSYENSAAYTKHLVANAVKADLASMGVDRAHPLEYEEVCLEVCGVKLVARPVETSTSAKLRVLAIAPPASEHVKKYLKDVPASWEKALQNSAVPLKEIDAKKYQRWIRNSRLKKAGCATGVATAVVSTGAAGFFFWHWLTSILPDGPELSL
ncbi:putative transmembrane protein [Gregarina niphandrodes]|uniref:Transmembrane protein n=1 Tax=Gregarina niphandrodes TaxID=110365 RepID=A0A023BB92_GRENI|nr:putative transmembrane protein [Gregarina niphandrodes]EZG79373.1 putative transmembrane protein [Gregarina niphandrodes]|eukprot:XP_011129061.1 putative transmembrane protein [Gregarina niphandrodes]